MSRSAGRLVLITGASKGIGRAAALAFAQRGDRVAAIARGRDALEALTRESKAIHPFVGDVADDASMKVVATEVEAALGLPDVVVANAGIGLDAIFTETTDEALTRLFEINVIGVYRTVRPFLSGMIERGSGRILFVSSIVGKRGIPHYSGYSASKFALHGMADALRAELWGTGLSVGVVCPGSTETDFRENALKAGPPQQLTRPVRRSADSVARAIVSMAGSRRRERILGFESKLMTLLDSLVPGFVDWVLARALSRKG